LSEAQEQGVEAGSKHRTSEVHRWIVQILSHQLVHLLALLLQFATEIFLVDIETGTTYHVCLK